MMKAPLKQFEDVIATLRAQGATDETMIVLSLRVNEVKFTPEPATVPLAPEGQPKPMIDESAPEPAPASEEAK
jgi:hypothetical protein